VSYRVAFLSAALAVQATSAAAFEQFESHDHGVAQLSLALENQHLEVEFVSPAFNLVGFEHKVRTEAQHQAVNQMLKTLHQSYQMVRLDESALCLLDRTEIEQNLLAGDDHEGHKDHDDHDEHEGHKGHDDHDEHEGHKGHDDHDEHEGHKGHDDHDEHEGHKGHDDHDEHEGHKGHDDHDEHKGHDDHDDHKGHDHGKHEHDHDAGGESSHSEVRVNWSFRCMKPENLKAVEIGLFKAFDKLEKVDAQWVAPNGQGAAVLNGKNTRFEF